MPVGFIKEDLRALRSLSEDKENKLLVTDAVERFFNKDSRVFTFPDGIEHKDVQFYKSNFRQKNESGVYAINFYYGSYLSRPAMVDVNDFCVCKRGESVKLCNTVYQHQSSGVSFRQKRLGYCMYARTCV